MKEAQKTAFAKGLGQVEVTEDLNGVSNSRSISSRFQCCCFLLLCPFQNLLYCLFLHNYSGLKIISMVLCEQGT